MLGCNLLIAAAIMTKRLAIWKMNIEAYSIGLIGGFECFFEARQPVIFSKTIRFPVGYSRVGGVPRPWYIILTNKACFHCGANVVKRAIGGNDFYQVCGKLIVISSELPVVSCQ